MSRKAWQVPYSLQPPNGRGTAHWFERRRSTALQVTAACGMAVTPGFAELAAPGAPQCRRCARIALGALTIKERQRRDRAEK